MPSPRSSKPSYQQLLADFFRARPQQWIDGRRLQQVAGGYAWRTRVSDLRRPPFNMTIENRQRLVIRGDKAWKVSEYRFVAQQTMTFEEERPHV